MASGLCIGQQGPLVHISACVGNVVSRFFSKYAKNEAKRREMLSAASAAGVSVAFGAPIGGVLFSLEEVSYYFPSKTMWRSFVCALAAAVTIKVINPFGTGKLVTFQVTYHHAWHTFELIPFALLGVIGGIFGAIFVRISLLLPGIRRTLRLNSIPLIEVSLITLLTGLISYRYYLTRISINELIRILFSECSNDSDPGGLCANSNLDNVLQILLQCLLIKALLTVATLGLRIPSGVACAGRILGVFIQKTIKANPERYAFVKCDVGRDCIIPGVYAMVGAAAAISGVTRMTVSLVITMVELTGALTYVLPIMTSIMVAKWTADRLCKDSIYDALIRKSGHPYLDHKRQHHHKDGALGRPPALASDVAYRDVQHCFDVDLQYSEVDICDVLQKHGHTDSGFPVVKKEVLIGYLGFTELEHALPPISVPPITSMELVTELFIKLGIKTLCVKHIDGRYAGVIHKKRLLAWLNTEIED
ncbi:chloride channel [Chytridium lagenaria]|nr:chloride channel [Chytridium lagenaria]